MDSRHGVAPEQAENAAGFLALMRELKDGAGLTYRQLEERAAEQGSVLARSTLADVLNGRTLPRPELLSVFVRACGAADREADWLRARDALAAPPSPLLPAPPSPADERPPAALRRRIPRLPLVASFTLAAAVLVWALTPSLSEQPAAAPQHQSVAAPQHQSVAAPAVLPTGWVRIRPVTAPELCLTDGRVRDQRYTPLVAVQRPCGEAGPQATLLEPLGGDEYHIQWHHPDYGKGCLKALTDGPGLGLLEPMDDCIRGSHFHVEPSGPAGSGTYVLRVDGQGCAGIAGDGTGAGTETVMAHCVGRGGQVFFVEPVTRPTFSAP
ncbi:helix-turn-helix transcriptional regulator [Kitasatospora sp. Root107]|uniref:helix-turn-helix domain-containing protein n=1 Tax=Kitasatospora sp. Root107 TaxID=1736424 RepID=UPI000AFE40CD|nr:helix-turn-helix transcriptional regulator [Kitasatospora sp. Root107]